MCCLFFVKFSYINNMKSFKKIRIEFKYDYSFLLKPLMLLSVLSFVAYGFKFIEVSFADDLMLGAVIVVVAATLINHIKSVYKRISIILILLIAFVLYINVYDDIIIFLAKKCENNGIFFGVVNSVFNSFGLTDFQELIYHTSYGGSKLINGRIATGAIDIYLLKNSCREASMYLCGKYLLLFAGFGISFAIDKHRKEVFFITLFTFLTGNMTVYLLMLLLVFTPYYFIFLLFNFFCYFIPTVADVKGGFSVNGSLFELLIHRENIVFIIVLGIFICAVAYYFTRLVKEKRKW